MAKPNYNLQCLLREGRDAADASDVLAAKAKSASSAPDIDPGKIICWQTFFKFPSDK